MTRWQMLAAALPAALLAGTVSADDSFAGARKALTSPETVPGRFIVELQPLGDGPQARDEATDIKQVVNDINALGYEATVKDDFSAVSGRFQGASVDIANSNDSSIDDIERIAGVARVWPVETITLNVSFSVGDSPSWNPHAATRVDELHARGLTGSGQRVCVVDSGIDVNHPALKGKVAGGRNLVDDNDDLTDCNGHGTFVSSVIVGQDADFKGVAYEAEVAMYKIFACAGTTSNDLVLKGLLAADADGCDIISLSVGSDTGYENAVTSRVASQIAQDRLVVIAAGNSGAMGAYFASSPASGKDVLSVGSIEAAQIMGWPAFISSSSGESYNISYVTHDGAKYDADVDVPLDLGGNDGCNLDWDLGTTDTAVLVKRGVCNSRSSYRSVVSAGYGYGILFDSYNQGVYYDSELAGYSDELKLFAITAADVGRWAKEQVAAGNTLRLQITKGATPAAFASEVASAGRVSEFTSWGPTFENGFSPLVSAPGGVVYGAFPDGVFAVASGTSFSTPYVAGVAALYYANGNKDHTSFVRRLASTAIAQPAFNAQDGKVVAEVGPLAQQGAGLIDAAKLFDYAGVLVSAPALVLNDTDNRVSTHTIRIHNTGETDVVYNITHAPAASLWTRSSTWYSYEYWPRLTPEVGSLSAPSTLAVPAGETREFEVTFSAPQISAQAGALWSGKVVLEGDNDEVLSVPYMGVEASTYDWTPLHHSPESYRYDQFTGELYPVDHGGEAYKPAEYNSPEVYFAFRYGTYEFSIDIVGPDWTTDQFTYPPVPAVGRDAWYGSIRFSAAPEMGYMDFPMREVQRFNMGSFVTFISLANGTEIPSGRYRIFTRALRMFGDASKPEDWQLFLSDSFSIQLGDDPVPAEPSTASVTTAAASSTVAASTVVPDASTTAPASASSSEPVTSSEPVISVPGPTTTLTAAATPTGLSDGFKLLRLQRLRESSNQFSEVDGWMELRIQVSLPGPLPQDAVISFGVPEEIVDIAADNALDAPAGTAGRTEFDEANRLFKINFSDWTTWNKNLEGDFFVFCRFKPEFAATMKRGTYVVEFPTVGRTHQSLVYLTAVDRTDVYNHIYTEPYEDNATLYIAEVEVPASLGPWDYVQIETSHTADDDGFVCDESSVSIGSPSCGDLRLRSTTDVTKESFDICTAKRFRAIVNSTVEENEVVRFKIANLQGSRDYWTVSMQYGLDIQLSNGTLVLLDFKTLLWEKYARQRTFDFTAFTGERAVPLPTQQ
ncbi:alkaline elastase YaB [Plectosphaerella cucumerina]|uniref:Alkaline elastase YaB n=1 Tax=Plectosphaerella cucumerina TaxID=40658 RepID=A0A8K0TLC5_9PEZI|nr:alkaline elastase YaB [Plectosphaerella cucumerina]